MVFFRVYVSVIGRFRVYRSLAGSFELYRVVQGCASSRSRSGFLGV